MERRQLSKAYTGATAADYEERRSGSGKWGAENDALRSLLTDIPAGSRILDVPAGTGRFLSMYESAGLKATGADISQDMLREAASKRTALGSAPPLVVASVFALPFRNAGFDATLCIRLLNWLSVADLRVALVELSRVSGQHVIAGIRSAAQKPGLWNTLLGRRSAPMAKSAGTGKTIVHQKSDIADAFRIADLTVVREAVVPHGLAGTEYTFYLLRKGG